MTSRKSSKPSTGDASDHLQLATIVLDALTLTYHSLFYHYSERTLMNCNIQEREGVGLAMGAIQFPKLLHTAPTPTGLIPAFSRYNS